MDKNRFHEKWLSIKTGGGRFFRRYGSACAIVGCVALVGITYLVTAPKDQQNLPDLTLPPVAASPAPGAAQQAATSRPTASALPTPSPEPTGSAETGLQLAPSKLPKLLQPVAGGVQVGYAQDKLVFSPTLNQWSTHLGLDIVCAEGSEVMASLAGTVESVQEDHLMGTTVTLTHDDGVQTVYAALKEAKVQTGQKVARGDVIGLSGNTASSENKQEPHLHFEAWADGEPADPTPVLVDK